MYRLEFVSYLFVLLVLARLFGELAERMGQTATVGELISGLIVGLAALHFGQDVPFLPNLVNSHAVQLASQLGIFFLLLYAGIEMQPQELVEHPGSTFAVALGGLLVPLIGGFALAWSVLPDSDLKQAQALLVGTALAITAIPVTVKVFMEFGLLHTRIGETVVSAAVFDDVMGLILLVILTGVIGTGFIPDAATLALLALKVVALFAVTIGFGIYVYPWLFAHVPGMRTTHGGLTFLLAAALGFAMFAENLGMHFILGPFIAGLYFEPNRVGSECYEDARRIIGGITTGFLAPIFFASIGLQLHIDAVTTIPGFLGALIVVAVLGKMLGCGIPAYFSGLGGREALIVGTGMSGRGAMELIIAGIALEAGLFAATVPGDVIIPNLFSALVITGVVTTLMTPLVLRMIIPRDREM